MTSKGRTRSSASRTRSRGGNRTPIVLTQFSTRLPPEVLERLRTAAPQLGLRQSDITAVALDRFLRRRGF